MRDDFFFFYLHIQSSRLISNTVLRNHVRKTCEPAVGTVQRTSCGMAVKTTSTSPSSRVSLRESGYALRWPLAHPLARGGHELGLGSGDPCVRHLVASIRLDCLFGMLFDEELQLCVLYLCWCG